MRAFGEKAFEPFFGFRGRVGPSDAERVEAAGLRLTRERRLDLGWIQKSRSA
jgi:hypothetical protein